MQKYCRDARKYEIKKYEKKKSYEYEMFFHTFTSYSHFESKYEMAISYFILHNFESMIFFLLNKKSNEVYQPNTTHWSSEIYIILLYCYSKRQATNSKQIIIIYYYDQNQK